MIPFFSRMFPGTNLQDLNLDWICRRIIELSKGIIAPWINAQNQHWMVYDTAAETFVDSGVSAVGEGTGPQGEPGKSPVIGTNGNWYCWDASTQAYTDTGIRAEGPAGPAGPEGPRAGSNLLDNWYFVGGGSQQGGGQFPINQRGLTIYSSYGYSIDRWIVGLGLQIESAYITIPTGEYFIQKLEPALFDRLVGRTVTASILLTGNVLLTGTAVISATEDVFFIQSDTINVYMTSSNKAFSVNAISGLSVIAVKMELGSKQTLAHQENGVWVVNEIPDYGQELSKCQRYYETGICYTGLWPIADTFETMLPFKVTKAKTPSFENLNVAYFNGSQFVSIPNAVSYALTEPLYGVRIYSAANGVPANKTYLVTVSASADL